MESGGSIEVRRTPDDTKFIPRVETFPSRFSEAQRRSLVVIALIFSDTALAFLSWGAAVLTQVAWGGLLDTGLALTSIATSAVVWVSLRALLGLYPGYGLDQVEELRRQTYASLFAVATMALFLNVFRIERMYSMEVLIAGLQGLLALLLLGPLVRYVLKRAMRDAGLWGKTVLVLGYNETGTGVAGLLKDNWYIGYRPVAIFDYEMVHEGRRRLSEDKSPEEILAGAVDLAESRKINTAIFAMPHTRREQLARLVAKASTTFRHVIIMPNLGGITNSAVVARDLAGTFGVEIGNNLLDPWTRRAKRVLDLVCTVAGGLAIAPLLIALIILIKLDSPGPAFYAHRRLGAGDKHFRCWKFRTMHANAEQLLNEYLQGDPNLQAEWERSFKLQYDPRVTRIGRFLRKTSLDELPQLWNVLRGEMSLVGPRPIIDAEVCNYGEVYELYKRIRPGISGLWQVGGRSDTSYEERVKLDAYYVHNWSVWLDFVILARTVRCVLLGRGAY